MRSPLRRHDFQSCGGLLTAGKRGVRRTSTACKSTVSGYMAVSPLIADVRRRVSVVCPCALDNGPTERTRSVAVGDAGGAGISSQSLAGLASCAYRTRAHDRRSRVRIPLLPKPPQMPGGFVLWG